MRFLGLIFALLLTTQAHAGFQAFSSTTNLGNFNQVTCSTGLTCTKIGSKLNMVASPTQSGNLTLSGAEATDIVFKLQADESDDNGDDWALTSVASGNALTFSNDTSGSLVTKLSLSTAGVLTFADSETLTNASDAVSIGFDDAAARVNVVAFEATDSSIYLQADESDDNGDDWAINSVASGNTLTISNDTSGSQVAKLTMAASDGDITLTGGITGDGGDTLGGFLSPIVAITSTSITAAQCGSTFLGDSADVIVLPEASTVLGCTLTFVAGTADDVDINPADGTDVIGGIAVDGAAIAPAAGDAVRMTDIGTTLTLRAVSANLWVAIGHTGPITDVN